MINKSTNKKRVSDYAVDWSKYWSRVEKSDGCWNWTGALNSGGYPLLSVKNIPSEYERTGRTYSQVLAHRVMAARDRDLQAGDYVCHTCDNPKCVRPDHLYVGSALDNMLDMILKGRAHWQKEKKSVSV